MQANILKLDGQRNGFITEALFVSTMGSWAYFRLWLMPTRFIYAVIVDSRRACDGGAGVLDSGGWNLLKSLQVGGLQSSQVPYWAVCSMFLTMTTMLQVYWYVQFCMILCRILTVGMKKAGEKESKQGLN